jgi:NADH-quinone oxidoreductase subunit L
VAKHIHESPPVMTIPLMILAVLSVVGGFVGFPIIEGGHKFKEFLSPSITAVSHGGHPPVSLEVGLMFFSMAVAGIGIYTAYKLYMLRPDLPGWLAEKFKVPYDLIYNKYYVDEIYDTIVVEPVKDGSTLLWTQVDDKVVDGAVNGSASTVAWLSAHLRRLETGFLQNYALAIVLGLTLVVGYLLG